MAEFRQSGEGREEGFPSVLVASLQSLTSSLDDLQKRVEEKDVDVCVVTQKKAKGWDGVNIPGYSLWKGQGKGNIALFVRDDITSTRLPIQVPESLDALWVRVDPRGLPGDVSCVVICVVNHPFPHTSRLREPMIAHLIEGVEGTYSQEPDSGVVIVGDFKDFPEHRLPPELNLEQVGTRPTQRHDAADTIIITNVARHYRRPKSLKPFTSAAHRPVMWIPK
ncbi:hypothetical protein Pmani_034123 [Petrolisthes manimaculis]|uniref:Endonuclease/exonuclease/phosphatase domain-containing protein n=1 Tax=Petrolisthes manimaculis TaxID=1843537 RepID=A0AAE1NNE9_9EUCA|nr:hypothetical protein Pmani_034123 [Petrolisthes manimaculis]